jgi:hypothetical protein
MSRLLPKRGGCPSLAHAFEEVCELAVVVDCEQGRYSLHCHRNFTAEPQDVTLFDGECCGAANAKLFSI